MDRGKPGAKMHILSDANGLPLVVGVSAANTQRTISWLSGYRRLSPR
ncbi:transposase [Streptomyces lydicamycinicus]|uniref:Transposase n=1 Tax=Streptomyces lydicamycinicus TaxID=1546107 RepID=A0A0N7YMS5_9ACTN|nr:transposase [Streptomyces lydicamycinicus]